MTDKTETAPEEKVEDVKSLSHLTRRVNHALEAWRVPGVTVGQLCRWFGFSRVQVFFLTMAEKEGLPSSFIIGSIDNVSNTAQARDIFNLISELRADVRYIETETE